MDGMRGPTAGEIVQWGAVADAGLDVFIAAQREVPNNFKDLVEVLMRHNLDDEGRRRDFFLAITLATAIIRLAIIEGVK